MRWGRVGCTDVSERVASADVQEWSWCMCVVVGRVHEGAESIGGARPRSIRASEPALGLPKVRNSFPSLCRTG